MDLGSIIGLGLGVAAVFIGLISGGVGLEYYIDVASILIVVVGSFGAVMTASPMSRVTSIGKFIGIILRTKDWKEGKLISDLVAFSERARREGLLALEDNLDEVEDEFMRKGMQLVVDGIDPEIIKNILYAELNQVQTRHESGAKFFATWGSLAPAFGMIGTLIGLIAMLANLQDESSIASGMATALITTLYGSMLANMVLIPFQNKLEDRDAVETRAKEIIIEGILSIQAGDNPRILLEKLTSYMPPKEREAIKAEVSKE